MTKTLLGLLLLAVTPTLVPTPAMAQNQVDISKLCPKIGELSTLVMRAKQSGVPLTKSMSLAESITMPALKELVRKILLDAYGRPNYSSDLYRQNQVTEFANEWTLACYSIPSKD